MIGPQGYVGYSTPVVGATVEEQAEVVVPSIQGAAGEHLDIAEEFEAVFFIIRIGEQVVTVCSSDEEVEAVTAPGVQVQSNACALWAAYPGRLKEAYSLPGAFLSAELGRYSNGSQRLRKIR